MVVGCAIAILWPALFGTRSRRGVVATGLLVLLLLQWQIEGFRWQLLALFVVAVGLAIGDVVSVERDIPWFRRIGRGIFGLLGLGLAAAPALILPVPQLPTPSGPMTIGTVTVEITHSELIEEWGPNPGRRRRFVAQVWYPADPAEDAEPVAWEPNIEVVGPALARRIGRPGFFFNQVRYTDSHAFAGARPIEGAHPVIVYSHHLERLKTVAIDQVEELASQGYVVIAIDHTYAAVASVMEDQTVEFDAATFDTPDATDAERAETRTQTIAVLAADIGAVFDAVDEGADGVFGEVGAAMDPAAIGVWGHGFGGGAALEACLLDDRCDAVAGLDPIVEPMPNPVLAVTATRPMLFMRSDPARGTANDAVLRGIVERSETLTYWVDVLGADMSDFTASPLISPVADRFGLKGPIDGERVILINHRYLTGFFDRFLLGTGSAALDTATFPEVDTELVDRRTQ